MNLGGSQHFICGDSGGAPVFGPDGTPARQLGLNLPQVAEILRRLAFATGIGGAVLRISQNLTLPGVHDVTPFGVLVFVKQTIRPDSRVGYVEVGVSLHCSVIAVSSEPVPIEEPQKRDLLYLLLDATVARVKPDPADNLVVSLRQHEDAIGNQLRRPFEPKLRSGVRHAVTPLIAALVLR